MLYVNLIDYYLILTKSIRTGNFDLFKYILPKIANLFFALNHQNYSRWLVKYHDNLLRVDETHPGLKLQLEPGSFGVKITNKPFSRIPIDLTLEQTINADAARRLTGIMHMTNSIAARQRWSKSHGIRSFMISHVLEEIGIKKNQDITADLQNSIIRKSTLQLSRFLQGIKERINPFEGHLQQEFLYNITSGQAISDEISKFLLNIEENRDEMRRQFIGECSQSQNRFEQPIKKNKIFNFTSALKKSKTKVAGKLQEVKLQRDLFGRLLGLSLSENIDIKKVLRYPLTPVPLSMCHLDGSICKTTKSILMKLLEVKVDNHEEIVNKPDIVIIDGYFLLHCMKEVPITYGNISKKILQMITNYSANRIDLIFDKYFNPSIKDYEHALRGSYINENYVISGVNQKRKSNFSVELKNMKFKEAFVKFLIEHWACDDVAPLIGSKIIHVNFDLCYKYSVQNGKVNKIIEPNLTCEGHEEADTKIIYHVCNIDQEANVRIRCSDTDIFSHHAW